jgi:hypothetical protein
MSTDGKRKALAKGKRVSKAGNVYYESRPNRSDVASTKIKKALKSGKMTKKEAIKKIDTLVKKGKMK